MTDVKIHEIKEEDLSNGFLESLDSLRKASNLSTKRAKEILQSIRSNPNHIIYVAELDSKIVGATTLFIEQKFIHDGGLVGHIEDVVVRKGYQNKGIGQKLVKALLEYAKNEGCYKTILDCTDDLRSFYENIGFKRHSNSMRFDH